MQTIRKIQKNYKLIVRISKKFYPSDKGTPVHLERYSFLINSILYDRFLKATTQELNYFLLDEDSPLSNYNETDYETIFNEFAESKIDRYETEARLKKIFNKVRDLYNHEIQTDREPTQPNQEEDNQPFDLDFDLTSIISDSNSFDSYDFSKIKTKKLDQETANENDLEFILNQEIAKTSN